MYELIPDTGYAGNGSEDAPQSAQGASADQVTGLVNAINNSVAITAAVAQWGMDYADDPIARYLWAYDNWGGMWYGFKRIRTELRDLRANRDQAAAYIANPDNWWNKALGHAKNPFYMEGQKNYRDSYNTWRHEITNTRWPDFDNMDDLNNRSAEDKAGNLEAYRVWIKNYIATILTVSAVGAAYLGRLATALPPQGMLSREVLSSIWPNDPDAQQGRVPAALRGELLATATSIAAAGGIPPLTDVPMWLLGFNEEEAADVVRRDFFSPLTYQTLLIIKQARDARLARQLGI